MDYIDFEATVDNDVQVGSKDDEVSVALILYILLLTIKLKLKMTELVTILLKTQPGP